MGLVYPELKLIVFLFCFCSQLEIYITEGTHSTEEDSKYIPV